MRCLVIGGTGWVGHHIALAMHAAGHTVTVASRSASGGFAAQLPEIVVRLTGDKTNASDVARWLDEPYDVVFDSLPHAASVRHLFAHRSKIGHYLHCSSTGGYAPLQQVPGHESLPYDHFLGGWAHKHEVDTLALDLHREDGLPVTVLRPTYITGPGLLPLDNFGGRRKDFLQDLLQQRPVTLPEDGQALLQPVHVADVAEGFRLAAAHPAKSTGQVFIVTQDHALTLRRYIELTAEALNVKANLRFAPVEQILAEQCDSISERGLRFVATHMCFSIGKIRRELGYAPRYGAEDAVIETANWAARHLQTTVASA